MAFNYHIEIRNKSDELVAIIQQDVAQLSWRYDAVGGCSECQFILRRPFDDYGEIALDYDVQIWRIEDVFGSPGGTPLPAILDMQLGSGFTNTKELRWSGFVRQIAPVLDEVETVVVGCAGYVRQLEYLVIPNQTYGSADVAAIAQSIVDTYVLPGSKIQRTGALGLVQSTGVAVSSTGLRFFASAYEAIRTLGEIGGNAEWGVRADREFFFMPRSTAVKQTWVIGDRVKFYSPQRSTDEIVNRVYLQGAGGTIYTLNNGAYQSDFQKERVIQVASIATAADASLWGLSYFSKWGTSQPKGQLKLGATDKWIENVTGETMPPLGRLKVIGGPLFARAGEAFTMDFPLTLGGSYGAYTNDQFRIESIKYSPSENGLNIDIELGEKRGALTDFFRAIDFKLSELRQGAL